jgi:hypothetical protein
VSEEPDAGRWFFLDARESALMTAAFAWLREVSPAQESLLRANLARLEHLAVVIRDSAPIATSWASMRWREAPGEALVDLLCRVPAYDLELHLPTRAVIGQAYLVAKINLFKAVGYALTEGDAALRARAEAEVAESVASKMVEELLVCIVTDPAGERALKGRAAALLFRVWDERLLAEVDDIAPLLAAAWDARNRVRPVLGAMLGAHEVFRLFQEARDERFLDYYTAEVVPEEEMAAFEEFLFGLLHEDIAALRQHLREARVSCISIDEARVVLGPGRDAWAEEVTGPQALYTNYRRRRMMAASRALTGAPGPKKTAEEYVLAAWLRRGHTL